MRFARCAGCGGCGGQRVVALNGIRCTPAAAVAAATPTHLPPAPPRVVLQHKDNEGWEQLGGLPGVASALHVSLSDGVNPEATDGTDLEGRRWVLPPPLGFLKCLSRSSGSSAGLAVQLRLCARHSMQLSYIAACSAAAAAHSACLVCRALGNLAQCLHLQGCVWCQPLQGHPPKELLPAVVQQLERSHADSVDGGGHGGCWVTLPSRLAAPPAL
jgi:hypothetical protein